MNWTAQIYQNLLFLYFAAVYRALRWVLAWILPTLDRTAKENRNDLSSVFCDKKKALWAYHIRPFGYVSVIINRRAVWTRNSFLGLGNPAVFIVSQIQFLANYALLKYQRFHCSSARAFNSCSLLFFVIQITFHGKSVLHYNQNRR